MCAYNGGEPPTSTLDMNAYVIYTYGSPSPMEQVKVITTIGGSLRSVCTNFDETPNVDTTCGANWGYHVGDPFDDVALDCQTRCLRDGKCVLAALSTTAALAPPGPSEFDTSFDGTDLPVDYDNVTLSSGDLLDRQLRCYFFQSATCMRVHSDGCGMFDYRIIHVWKRLGFSLPPFPPQIAYPPYPQPPSPPNPPLPPSPPPPPLPPPPRPPSPPAPPSPPPSPRPPLPPLSNATQPAQAALAQFVPGDCSAYPCAQIFPMRIDPENCTVRATTLASIDGATGGGSGAVSSVELIDFAFGVIASGNADVAYACCANGVPRYVRVTVKDASLGTVVLGMGAYGRTGDVEPGLVPAKPREVPWAEEMFPTYGWTLGIIVDVAIAIVIAVVNSNGS